MPDLWRPEGKPFVVDMSHNNNGADRQRPIDFAALAADGVKLVIHKASQGNGMVDPCYAPRRKAALAAGLKWEAYHFCDGTPIAGQLQHFIAVAEPDDTMRLAIDCEPNGGSTVSFQAADVFAASLDQRRGLQCLRYTGGGFLTPKAIAATPNLRAGPIWWAKYGPQPTAAQLTGFGILPARVVLWQETPTGTRPGIAGPIDESWWLGTADELAAYPALSRQWLVIGMREREYPDVACGCAAPVLPT